MKSRILVIDDDLDTRSLLGDLLTAEGYEVSLAKDAAALRARYTLAQPDVALLDWRLPDADGIELLPELKQRWPDTRVIVLTGFATFDAAVEAVKHGAFHFLSKPFQPEVLRLLVQRACEHKQLHERTAVLRRALSTLQGRQPAVFSSPPMAAILRLVERIAGSDAPVLITGESGTGKEVVADLIHALSPRAAEPFVKVNCAALPRELIESELFGALKGAYTGAHADREGLFREAGSGTILLDEISEMPLDTQAKLLRVLQERSFRPVGGKARQSVDCRVLASTNRRVEEALREGRLREDVYYRISAVTVHLPPLRERREDILPLATNFLRRFAAQAGRVITGFDERAARALSDADWPGNVRQLENEIQRAVLLCDSGLVTPEDLSAQQPSRSPPAPGPHHHRGDGTSDDHRGPAASPRQSHRGLARTGDRREHAVPADQGVGPGGQRPGRSPPRGAFASVAPAARGGLDGRGPLSERADLSCNLSGGASRWCLPGRRARRGPPYRMHSNR